MFAEINVKEAKRMYVEEIINILGEPVKDEYDADEVASGQLNVYVDAGVSHECVIDAVCPAFGEDGNPSFVVYCTDFTDFDCNYKLDVEELKSLDNIIAVYEFVKKYSDSKKK